MLVKDLISHLESVDPELPVYRWRSGGEFYELPEDELVLMKLMSSTNPLDPYTAMENDPVFKKGKFREAFGPSFVAAVIY